MPVLLKNRQELHKVQGTMLAFEAPVENENSSSMSCVLQIEPGCKLMQSHAHLEQVRQLFIRCHVLSEKVQNVPADPEKKCCCQKSPSLNERYHSVGQPAEDESDDDSGNGDLLDAA
ncbi:hypothetical protein ACROYT_G015325 [Oculina patagonica]